MYQSPSFTQGVNYAGVTPGIFRPAADFFDKGLEYGCY